MVHVWARDILPTSLPNICKTPVKILSWMKDVIPIVFGKVLKEEEKQGTFLKKAPMFFLKKSHVSHDNSESNNLIDELLDDTLDTLAAPAGNDDWKEAAWQRKLRRHSKVRLGRRKH